MTAFIARGFKKNSIAFSCLMLVGFVWGVNSPAAALCQLKTQDPSVTICTPTAGNVPSPVHVVAGSTDSNQVNAMQIYVDDTLVYQVLANTIDTWIPLSVGNHRMQVKGWDKNGPFYQNVNVSQTPLCALSPGPSMNICTPGPAATVSTPIHLAAEANDTNPVTSTKLYLDGVAISSGTSAIYDKWLTSVKPGNHVLKLQATDNQSNVFSSTLNITVTDNSGLQNLHHIIFFVQENRSLDHYFGMMGQYRQNKNFPANWDALPLNVQLPDVSGQLVSPFPFQTVCHENLSPSWNESHFDVDGGIMDNFMKTSTSVPSQIDPDGTRAMGYYDWNDLNYYYELAFQFATSDRWFSPVLSQTVPNRMYLFAGTSFGHANAAPPPQGGWTQPTIFDKLDAAGISWRYYQQDGSVYLSDWATYYKNNGQDQAKIFPISQWYTDVQNEATLPSVIFIERAGSSGLDEHPGHNIQTGAANTQKILSALLTSPSWATSAFILSYDEGGGLYEHVVPATAMKPDSIPPNLAKTDQPGDFKHTGFRIPVIVVSPWVRPHYVSHTWRDLTSILRLIEVRFNVPALTARDASSDDMMEFFDFSSPSLLTPPPLPTQDTSAVCDWTKEKAPGH